MKPKLYESTGEVKQPKKGELFLYLAYTCTNHVMQSALNWTNCKFPIMREIENKEIKNDN